MELRAHAGVVKEPVAVAGTRSATMAFFGTSFGETFAFAAIAIVPTAFTLNPLWFLGCFAALIVASRVAKAGNPNRPREWWIAFRTGAVWRALLARGNGWGGERVDVPAAARPEASPCP